jgi:hypothetical protein
MPACEGRDLEGLPIRKDRFCMAQTRSARCTPGLWYRPVRL